MYCGDAKGLAARKEARVRSKAVGESQGAKGVAGRRFTEGVGEGREGGRG